MVGWCKLVPKTSWSSKAAEETALQLGVRASYFVGSGFAVIPLAVHLCGGDVAAKALALADLVRVDDQRTQMALAGAALALLSGAMASLSCLEMPHPAQFGSL